jgi:hypothetical protein
MRLRTLAPLACVLALALSPAVSAARPAPRHPGPTAIAKRLVNHFFVLLVHKDRPALEHFLSPAFQVERADGSGGGKRQYLASLPTVTKFELSKFTATRTGSVLVARYLARIEGVVNGKPYTPGFAPRLSVFSWNGKRWQIVAHANFNPLTG